MSIKLNKQTSFSYTKIHSHLYIMQMDDMPLSFQNIVKQFHQNLFFFCCFQTLTFSFNKIYPAMWHFIVCVALCTMCGTSQHIDPREMVPHAKSHKS